MSDTALGPQWWRAADGKWHPPELRPPSARVAVDPVLPDGDEGNVQAEAAPFGASAGPADDPAAQSPASIPGGDAEPAPATDGQVDAGITSGAGSDPGDRSQGATDVPTVEGGPAPEPFPGFGVTNLETPPSIRIASSMPIRPVEPSFAWGPTVPDSELPPEVVRAIPPFRPRTAADRPVPVASPNVATEPGSSTEVAEVVPPPEAAPVSEVAPPPEVTETIEAVEVTGYVESAGYNQVVQVTETTVSVESSEVAGAVDTGERTLDQPVDNEVPSLLDDDEGDLSSSLQALIFGDQAVDDEQSELAGTDASPVAPPATPLRLVVGEEVAEVAPQPTAPSPPPASRVTEPIPSGPTTDGGIPVPAVPAVPAAEPQPAPLPTVGPDPAAGVGQVPAEPAHHEPAHHEPAAAVADAPREPVPQAPAHHEPAQPAAEARPIEEVLAGPTVSGSAPRTTNIPASIAAKNAEHFKGSREFPDLLGMALKGSSLADQVEVKYDASSMRKPASGNAAPKDPPTGGSDKGGKRWKRKGR